jgi:hypothetical protein
MTRLSKLKELLVERGTVSGERKDPIQPLLDDSAVSEIFINGPLDIFARREGKLKKEHVSFADFEHINDVLSRIADETPHKVIQVKPAFVIEKKKVLDRKVLERNQSLAGGIHKMLALFMKAKANMVITGRSGMLKSTLLDVLLDETGSDRLVVIDPKGEIRPRPNAVILHRTGSDALDMALRLKAERIAINDDPSCLPNLLDIMLSGVSCVFTLEAATERCAKDLLFLKAAESHPHVPFAALKRMIHLTMDLLVHMEHRWHNEPVVADKVSAFAVYSSVYKAGDELCMPTLAYYGGNYSDPRASCYYNKDSGIPFRLRNKLSLAGIPDKELVDKFNREFTSNYQ